MSLIDPPPQTDTQLIRQMTQRLTALERKQTLRVGDWVLHSDDNGNLLATKPGADPLNVGNPTVNTVDLGALRGFVTETDVALAVSAGKTKDLNGARDKQVTDGEDTGQAQYTADNAAALAAQALAAIESGSDGVAFNDTFDRPKANDLGPDYDMVKSAGPNNYGTVGDGTAGHTTGVTGTNPQSWYFRRLSDLNTAQQRVTVSAVGVLNPGHDSSVNGRILIAGRVDSTLPLGTIDGRIEATVEPGRCRIGYFLGGGAAFVPLTTGGDSDGWVASKLGSSDTFDFWVGLGATGHDRFKFALLRNNLTIATADDIPENSAPLLANRQGAIGVRTPVSQLLFFANSTEPAISLQSANFADRSVAT